MKKSIFKAMLWGLFLGLALFILSVMFVRKSYADRPIEIPVVFYGPQNENCMGHKADAGCPDGYCIDVGMGQCIPLWTEKNDPSTRKKYVAYLYEMDDLRQQELKNADGSTVTAYTGQYFYLPVEPKGHKMEVNGIERVISYDITDLEPIKAAGIKAFEKVPNMFGKNLGTWQSWGGNRYPVKYNGQTITGFKHKFTPFGYINTEVQFTTEHTRTALYQYKNESGNIVYCVPRFVLDKNFNNVSFISFPNDTPPSGKSKIYAPSGIEANPWKKNKNISKQTVNLDWVLSETGDSQKMSDLWNRALATGSNGKQYLNPNSDQLTDKEKQKVRAFYSTVRMIIMAWGDGVKSETYLSQSKEEPDITKEYDGTEDYGIVALLNSKKGLSAADVKPYYPGPLEPEKFSNYSEEYINEYFTACGKVFLKYFSINEYCGLGLKNYGKIMASKWDGSTHWYCSYNLGKAVQNKNLFIWGGEKLADDTFYEPHLWRPQTHFEETWESGTDEDRKILLKKMDNTEFLENFEMIDNRSSLTNDFEGNFETPEYYDGERLEYDYPYVFQSSLSFVQSEDAEKINPIAQTYHYDFKLTYSSLICDSQFYWHNIVGLTNRTNNDVFYTFPRQPHIFSMYWDYRYFNAPTTLMPEAVNNKGKDTEGYYVMPKDREIVSLIDNNRSILKGGRLWSYNVEPWVGFYKNPTNTEYGSEEIYNSHFIFGSSKVQAGMQPESDAAHKVTNVNVYRDVVRTPTLELAKAQKAAADETADYETHEDICFAIWSSIAEDECNYYTADYKDSRAYRDLLVQASTKSRNLKWNSLLDVNENCDSYDDTALVIYLMEEEPKEPRRNMRLVEVILRDEDGAEVKRWEQEKKSQIPTEDIVRLDPTKDYYVEYTAIYEVINRVPQKTDKQSINENLETECGNNGKLEAEFSTNRPEKWDDKDIGQYNHPDAKMNAEDNRHLNIKYQWEVRATPEISGEWTVKIPEKYNLTDNLYHMDWETFTIKWAASAADIEQEKFDNLITDIILIDQDGNKTFLSDACEKPSPIGDIDLGDTELNHKYSLAVKVERKATEEPHKDYVRDSRLYFTGMLFGNNINEANKLILSPALSTSQIKNFNEPVANNNGYLEKNGDYIYYFINDLELLGEAKICGEFTFEHINNKGEYSQKDDNPKNNKKIGAAEFGPLDFIVENLIVNPNKLYIPKGETRVPSAGQELTFNFSCDVSAQYQAPDGSYPIINNDALLTNFTIVLEEKRTDQQGAEWPNNKYEGVEVFRLNNLRLTVNGGKTRLTGILKINRVIEGSTGVVANEGRNMWLSKDSSYRLAARINGGDGVEWNSNIHESEPDHTVKLETNHFNNKTYEYITLSSPPEDIKPLCPTPRTENNWNVTFHFTECPTEYHYTYSCGTEKNPRTCKGCRGINCRSWTTEKSYKETYNIELYLVTLDGQEKLNGESKLEIRAGEKFQIKAKSIYWTDRGNLPSPNPYGGCAYRTRSPGYTAPSGYRHVRLTINNTEGNQQWVINTFQTGWVQWHESHIINVPPETKNMSIDVKVETSPFWGYRESTNQQLCDNSSSVVRITAPLPITQGNQTIE